MNQTSATAAAAAQSAVTTAPPSTASSVPTTPNFVRKFQSNFRPLDLRKITLYGYGSQSQDESLTSISSSTVSCATQSSSSSSSGSTSNGCTTQECTPKRERKQLLGAHHTYHSSSQDSFMLKRQSSQNRLRESLLASLLSPRFVANLMRYLCVEVN